MNVLHHYVIGSTLSIIQLGQLFGSPFTFRTAIVGTFSIEIPVIEESTIDVRWQGQAKDFQSFPDLTNNLLYALQGKTVAGFTVSISMEKIIRELVTKVLPKVTRAGDVAMHQEVCEESAGL